MIQDDVTFRDVIRGSIVIVLILCVLSYIMYQARFLVTGPQILLTEELPLLQNERVITLTGTASNISRLWLNGRPMYTDPQGNFATDVILQNGYTIATLRAEDRYGREAIITREFVYTPMSFSYHSN